jgi:hypothetical protein
MRRTLFAAVAVAGAGLLGGCGDSFFLSVSTDGIIEVRVQTDGLAQTGWRVRVDGGVERAVPAGGTVTLTSLRTGTHVVELSGVPAGCRVRGANPRQVLVNGDGPTPVSFETQCGGITAASAAAA